MLIAAAGFWFVNVKILALALGLMGAQSAFFSPTKNAVLPQWLTEKDLITGNALLNGFVFVFVLVGQVVGTLIVLKTGGPKIIACLLIGLAFIGWLASKFCPPAPPPQPELKINFEPISATWNVLSKAFDAPAVLRPMLGIAWFYGLSTILVTTFPNYVASEMHFNANVLIVLLALSTISILVGSLLTMFIAKWKFWGPEAIGLSALGITGVTLFVGLIYLLPSPVFLGERPGNAAEFLGHEATPLFLGALICASIMGGLFVVPLQAMAQRRADPQNRARLMSAGAVLLNLLVNLMTFILIGMAYIKMPPKSPFLIIIFISALVAIYALYRTRHPHHYKSYAGDN